MKEFAFLLTVTLSAVIALTVVLALSIDQLAQYIPFEFETALSQTLDKKLDANRGEVDTYLQNLTDKIVPYMHLPADMKIRVHYVNKDVINAMATLGGNIMVYRGLLEKLPDENTLVMLLGHEIGHVKLRHPVKALGKGVVISLVLRAILGQSSDSVAKVFTGSSMLTLLSFNRDQEQSADEEGIKVVNAYYGSVLGAVELFKILQHEEHKNTGSTSQFLSTHPNIENRIKYLNVMTRIQGWKKSGTIRRIQNVILRKLAWDKTQSIKMGR